MLALTHHIVVCAAKNMTRYTAFMAKGQVQKPDYAVLGDDIVISEDWDFFGSTNTTPENYLAIMESLGVEVSLQKSIISKDFVEFAKRTLDTEGHD